MTQAQGSPIQRNVMLQTIKATGLGVIALYMTIAGLFPQMNGINALLFQQSRISTEELQHRVERIETDIEHSKDRAIVSETDRVNMDHRVTVLEVVEQHNGERLQSIESLLRLLLVGLACVVGETVWAVVTKFKKA